MEPLITIPHTNLYGKRTQMFILNAENWNRQNPQKSHRSQCYKSQFVICDLTPLLRNASDTMKSQYINAILNCEFNDLFIRRHVNLKNILE